MKKIISIVSAAALIATMAAGCSTEKAPADTATEDTASTENTENTENTASTDAEGGETSSEGGRVFGYTCMDGTNPFFVALENSIREVVEANGDTLISMDPANDSNTQIDQIEDMISRGVEVMFVNPVDADGIIPALDMLKEADIPMFGFDTQVGDMSYLVSYAGSDNYNAGYVCGVDLAEKVPEGGFP